MVFLPEIHVRKHSFRWHFDCSFCLLLWFCYMKISRTKYRTTCRSNGLLLTVFTTSCWTALRILLHGFNVFWSCLLRLIFFVKTCRPWLLQWNIFFNERVELFSINILHTLGVIRSMLVKSFKHCYWENQTPCPTLKTVLHHSTFVNVIMCVGFSSSTAYLGWKNLAKLFTFSFISIFIC